ncbi:MAG TPA: hypothetical protein VHR66_15850 [Gemmataceae bacterium]|nr:hypothetical protein [Gemmataceae bacterium]
MRSLLLGLLVLPIACRALADDKKDVPAPARVVVTGKATAFLQATSVNVAIQGGEDVQKKIAEATKKVTATAFKIDDQSGIVVVLPANSFAVGDALKLIGSQYAVEGILTSTDSGLLIAITGDKTSKRVPLLIASKVTAIDDKNKADLPAENHALMEGTVKKGSWKLGTSTGEWSIQNANGSLPFVALKDAKIDDGSKLRVSGPVRVVAGEWLVEAQKAELVK